jgi:hypothetical protein
MTFCRSRHDAIRRLIFRAIVEFIFCKKTEVNGLYEAVQGQVGEKDIEENIWTNKGKWTVEN